MGKFAHLIFFRALPVIRVGALLRRGLSPVEALASIQGSSKLIFILALLLGALPLICRCRDAILAGVHGAEPLGGVGHSPVVNDMGWQPHQKTKSSGRGGRSWPTTIWRTDPARGSQPRHSGCRGATPARVQGRRPWQAK